MSEIRPSLAHMGIAVINIERMEDFYTKVFGLVVTDRGVGAVFKNQLVFLSGSPEQHHQVVLSTGRAPENPSTVMQLSFKVKSLDELRTMRERALNHGASDMIGLNHGNAWSIYFFDPEENRIEIYLDTAFHTPQPCGEKLDLSKSNNEIVAETEALIASLPGGMERSAYVEKMRGVFSGT